MNSSIVRYILGSVMKIEAGLMLLPVAVAFYYHEGGWKYFLIVAAATYFLGTLITLRKPQNNMIYLKEGCVATALSWIVMSIAGCLPFVISGEIPSFTNAMFETVSGFTTTGASILGCEKTCSVESLSNCMLFWRSFTHWIGGMGVLVFLLAIVPMTGGSNINLMRAESPGPSVGKFVPKMRTTARLLYIIYFGLTLIEFILLWATGMPGFDAITTAMGTAGTGGFGIRSSSITDYAPHLQVIVTVFMILFGVNFNAYFLIVTGKIKEALHVEEVRYYLLIILVATIIVFLNILNTSNGALDALNKASFQVASIITTTGFSTTDFNTWNEVSKFTLLLLMFIGACAGSTGGGIKVSRFMLLGKSIKKEIRSYIHPHSVKKIKIEGKPVEHDVLRSVNVYFITFMCIYAISIFLISIEGNDLVTNLSAVTATINNIGPGFGEVGPMGTFGNYTDFSKWVMIFDMLAGRLELFPMLILFYPGLWKEFFASKKSRFRKAQKQSKSSKTNA